MQCALWLTVTFYNNSAKVLHEMIKSGHMTTSLAFGVHKSTHRRNVLKHVFSCEGDLVLL